MVYSVDLIQVIYGENLNREERRICSWMFSDRNEALLFMELASTNKLMDYEITELRMTVSEGKRYEDD